MCHPVYKLNSPELVLFRVIFDDGFGHGQRPQRDSLPRRQRRCRTRRRGRSRRLDLLVGVYHEVGLGRFLRPIR